MPVQIKTLHGQFTFEQQRLIDKQTADETNFLRLIGQGAISGRLQAVAGYYSNRISYEEVAKLVERVTGERLLSDQTIQKLVVSKAVEVSEQVQQQSQAILSRGALPAINAEAAIYDTQAKEILLFDDGILVKGQKAHRDKTQACERSRINTSVLMLETPAGEFVYLTGAINGQVKKSCR